jgi:2-methylisocitrate lyase-like PEP mutase family enzyme
MDATRNRACGKVKAGAFAQTGLAAAPESLGQNDQNHLMMPVAPRPELIAAHPQLLLADLEAGFNRPSHAAGSHDPGQCTVGRGVRQESL